MQNKIRVAVSGYGNLGRGAVMAIGQCPDMELAAVVTRRDPASLQASLPGVPVIAEKDAAELAGRVDVMILCGGSATDLPLQGPKYAALFNTVDSFDTHAKIPGYFASMNEAASKNGHLSILSVGWDPGMFSLNRVYAESILPMGESYTFWGRGVSQGHSDAIRRIDGVAGAIQYTVPVAAAMEAARSGENPTLSARQKHTRECYVALKEGADPDEVERKIKTMPNYFDEYDTTVHFISLEELHKYHSEMPHGGFVIRSGKSASGKNHVIEYSLKLESNPEFTAGVLVAYARAAARLSAAGEQGARTVLDIAPVLLSPKTPEELRASML